MSENEVEIQIMKVFANIIPKLSNETKQYVLGFGEGLTIGNAIGNEQSNHDSSLNTLQYGA